MVTRKILVISTYPVTELTSQGQTYYHQGDHFKTAFEMQLGREIIVFLEAIQYKDERAITAFKKWNKEYENVTIE